MPGECIPQDKFLRPEPMSQQSAPDDSCSGLGKTAWIFIGSACAPRLDKLHRIYAEAYANQSRVGASTGKEWFILEDRLKNNALKNGKLLDSILYAKIKTA
jgi:hypothetical protein